MTSDYRLVFEAIGTRWEIDVFDVPSFYSEKTIKQRILAKIEKFDKTYSHFREDSFITCLKKEGAYKLPRDSKTLFDLYQKLYQYTDGFFTPLIGETLSQAGYDSSYSFTAQKLSAPLTWNQALSYNFPLLTLKKPVLLDVGAAGKGYLVDQIGQLLKKEEISSFCIDAGGDILYENIQNKFIRVGLENPDNTDQVIGVCEIRNESICGSAGNRRQWGKYHHIINPKTLQSPKNIKATWVIAEKTIISDALSTCLFFVKPEVLAAYFQFEYAILHKDLTVQLSKNFPGEIYYN